MTSIGEQLSIQEEIAGLQERLEQMRLSGAPPDWEEKYIILPGEVPWWRISDPKEGRKTRRRQYTRMWNKLHPGALAERKGKHVERHPGAAAEALRRFREKHPGYYAKFTRRYREKHPDAAAEATARYYRTPKGRATAAKQRAKHRERSTDPDAYAARIELLHIMQEPCTKCEALYLITHQIDHIVALCLGGTDDWDNLQPLCIKCHREKTKEDMNKLREKAK